MDFFFNSMTWNVSFFTYGCNFRHAQFHITTPQRVIGIMHYSHTLRHISAPAVCTRTLAEGAHREDLWRSAQPRNTVAALIILLHILPTSEGWKAEQNLPPPSLPCHHCSRTRYAEENNIDCSCVYMFPYGVIFPNKSKK